MLGNEVSMFPFDAALGDDAGHIAEPVTHFASNLDWYKDFLLRPVP